MNNDLQTNLGYIIMTNLDIFHTATLWIFFRYLRQRESVQQNVSQEFENGNKMKFACIFNFDFNEMLLNYFPLKIKQITL